MRAVVFALVVAIPWCPSPVPPSEPGLARGIPPRPDTDEELKHLLVHLAAPKCGLISQGEMERLGEQNAQVWRAGPRVPKLLAELLDEEGAIGALGWATNELPHEPHEALRDAVRRWRDRLDWPGRDRPTGYGDECVLARLRTGTAPAARPHPDWFWIQPHLLAPRTGDACALGRTGWRPPPARFPSDAPDEDEVVRWVRWEMCAKVLFEYFGRFGDASDLAWMEQVMVTLGYFYRSKYEDQIARLRNRLRAS